jgi:FkbM family methyltransferase
VALKSCLYHVLWCVPERYRPHDPVRDVLSLVRRCTNPVYFVNIGANDGLSGDPLREFIVRCGWHGLLVEPVPHVFERLARAYRGRTGVTCVNAAISETTGERPFWYLRRNDVLPPGYDQVGSFDKDQVMVHDKGEFPGLEPYLESRSVTCLTLRDLLARHGAPNVDVYLIDAEGYDARIVSQIGLDTHRPLVIIYEHQHLSPAERQLTRQHLANAGYDVREVSGNTVAVSPSLAPADSASRT